METGDKLMVFEYFQRYRLVDGTVFRMCSNTKFIENSVLSLDLFHEKCGFLESSQ